MKKAKDVIALKAVSQNLMHKNLSITDGVYGILSDVDVRQQITELGQLLTSNQDSEIEELKLLTKNLFRKLDESLSGN